MLHLIDIAQDIQHTQQSTNRDDPVDDVALDAVIEYAGTNIRGWLSVLDGGTTIGVFRRVHRLGTPMELVEVPRHIALSSIHAIYFAEGS